MLNIKMEDFNRIKYELEENSFSFLNTSMTDTACEEIKSFIDAFPDTQSELNYADTEKRIWSAQEYDSSLLELVCFSDSFLSDLFKSHAKAKTLLAYRNLPVPFEAEENHGRWHLDSLRHQFKVFCFLTQTTKSSGPLELVPGTHMLAFKLRHLLSGRLIGPSDIWTGKRRYQKLSDSWVNSLCECFSDPVPLLCDAGSLVVVDTSVIHRARPCVENNRYALSAYYGHF